MRILKRTVFVALWLGIMLYFLAHGDNGFTINAGLKSHADTLEAEVIALRAREEDLRARVARLRPGTLDLDYLEERARVVLNLAAPGELVVPPNILHLALNRHVDERAAGGYVFVQLD